MPTTPFWALFGGLCSCHFLHRGPFLCFCCLSPGGSPSPRPAAAFWLSNLWHHLRSALPRWSPNLSSSFTPALLTSWNVSSDCESLVRALLLTHSCSPSLVQVRIPSHLDYSGLLIAPPSGSFLNGGQTVFTCVSHTVLRALIDHRWCGSSLRSKHLSFSKLSVTLVGWAAHPMPSNLFCTHLKIQPPL